MPSSYDLYATLGLDRGRSPEQLAAELDQQLEGVTRETPQWNELSAARAVLGDPVRRSMYDQRLDDASQTVTPAEIQQLAAMNVGAASGSARGGFLGRAWRESPKMTATAGVLAVAVLVVGGLAIGSAVGGGDDDDTSSASASGSSSGDGSSDQSVELDPDDPHYEAQKAFQSWTFLGDGEKVSVGTAKEYEYNDGESKYTFPDGYDYEYSLSNFRTFVQTVPGDPDAPADHPDSKESTGAGFACVDITGTNLSKERKDVLDYSESKGYGTKPMTDEEAARLVAADIITDMPSSDSVRFISNDDYLYEPMDDSSKFNLKSSATLYEGLFPVGVDNYEDYATAQDETQGLTVEDFDDYSDYEDAVKERKEQRREAAVQVNGNSFTTSACFNVPAAENFNTASGFVILPPQHASHRADTEAVGWRFDLDPAQEF
ncbi:MAG: hypothetical protein ACTH1D_06790 [Mycobacteriaceae bacterium]|uniref:J domain-containing protein n=1 Tax=Corynebacterium variabile (strain DSM 44702 / CIP 107183 / JCM 12073 / NCIMB 30131) TaxID=858619 RepID=G0HF29_CORVD|nr:hypothetical protein [Corynebacterium variabile]AEK37481.1 hypothetical protein CVAR_2131 [Corynebacterium variabile DSM 44702]